MSDINIFRNEWENAFDCHRAGFRPCDEFDWFAVDSKGKIACFITAGFALVPKLVFRDKEILWKIYNHFYKEPEDYVFVRKTSSLIEYDVSFYANQGLYSYDNPSNINKPYQIVRSPESALRISDLSTEIRQWLEPLTIKGLDFDDSEIIDIGKYFECI